MGSQFLAPASLLPKNEPIDCELDGLHSQSGLFGEERKISSLPGIEMLYLSCTAKMLDATSKMQTISSEY